MSRAYPPLPKVPTHGVRASGLYRNKDARNEPASTPDPFLQLIQDYAAPRMRFGRAVLLGDATFVVRPHTGAGAGKAAANAVALARALQAGGERIDDALAVWDRSQWAVDRRLAQWGISLGRRIMGVMQPD